MSDKRVFESGASRDTDEGKLDYSRFISPRVLHHYAVYMHRNRKMADGSLRAGDNWQKGIPQEEYLASLIRHVHDVWLTLRGDGALAREDLVSALCGIKFNTDGLLFEATRPANPTPTPDPPAKWIDTPEGSGMWSPDLHDQGNSAW